MEFYASKEWADAPSGSPGGEAALRWMIGQTQISPGGQILDLCCGRGESARYLSEKGYRVIGIDRSKGAIETAGQGEAQRQDNPLPQFQIGDARDVDLPDHSQEGVLCQCSLSLFREEIPLVLKEIHRILQPDGWFLLADLYWDRKNPAVWKREITEQGFVLKEWNDCSEVIRAYCAEYVWKTGKIFPACVHGVGAKVRAEELGYFLSVWRCV